MLINQQVAAVAAGMLCAIALIGGTLKPAAAAGSNGTTLAASKTVDICRTAGGQWKYSGEISVWNEGAVATQNLLITDCIEHKVGTKYVSPVGYCQSIVPSATPSNIAAGTTQLTAIVYPYSLVAAPLTGIVRNNAVLTITNHSGSLAKPKGPNPKATYAGLVPPPLCANQDQGTCVHGQGYWGDKPGVVWPAGFNRTDLFFNSGLTWQQILDASAGGNGYIILAKQYIAAKLNVASGSAVPSGVTTVISDSAAFFTAAATPSAACPLASSCGIQKTWGGILDTYNNGTYPGGPAKCGDDE